jgi:hypothetical protein
MLLPNGGSSVVLAQKDRLQMYQKMRTLSDELVDMLAMFILQVATKDGSLYPLTK